MAENLEDIKELREATGLSFNEIKKALEEAGGDKTKAVEALKARGVELAQKRAVRATQQGIITSYIHGTGKVGVLMEVLCETDFVAKNPLFSELAHELAMHTAAMGPESLDELLEQDYIKDPSIKIKDLLTQYIAKIGENIKVGRFARYQI